ncbi:tetratricopeptide repeat protein [Thalassotalea litorea]|uniref:hypothetical protein n=1 Tax=Thalassotalea litorea TaxID=2020715 RepID=UPI003736E4CE
MTVVIVISFALVISGKPFWVATALNSVSSQYPENSLLHQLSNSFNHPQAQQHNIDELVLGSRQWLRLSRAHAKTNGETAFALSRYFREQKQHQQAELWLGQAVRLMYPQAIEKQALTLMSDGEFAAAKTLIAKLDNKSELFLALMLQLTIALEQGDDIQQNIRLLEQLNPEHELIAAARGFAIADFWQQDNMAKSDYQNKLDCATSVQFFAGSLSKLQRLTELIENINRDPFFLQEFCLFTPQYIPQSILNCEAATSGRLVCDINALSRYRRKYAVDYIGVLSDAGRANVNHGVVYLDMQDDADVVKHELLHLIGFIDEYPLPKNHQVCEVKAFSAVAKNIVVDNNPRTEYPSEEDARREVLTVVPWASLIKPTTPITQMINGTRVLGTPAKYRGEVGLFAAETCEKQGRASFKPEHTWGLMRYNSLPLSSTYQQIHANNAGKFAMKTSTYQPVLQPQPTKN